MHKLSGQGMVARSALSQGFFSIKKLIFHKKNPKFNGKNLIINVE
jgi:hypothetical protein